MGTMLIYQTSQPNDNIWNTLALNFGLPYFSISIALNILLTLMIIIRLVLYTRDICTSTGAPAGVGGLYKAIVTMLIESCALYAVSSLLFIGLWGAGKPVANIFLTILSQTQVRAFPRSRSLDRLSNATTESRWLGHRTTVHHPTGRQQEGVDG